MLSPTTFAQTLKKLPPPLYKALAQKWINYVYPRHVFIELTSKCNLRCSYCPRPKLSRSLPYRLFKKIVDEASLYGKVSFSLHLFGEPLLYPRIIEAIRYIKKRGHAVILTTNGTLLRKYWRDLADVDKIIWSYKEGVEVPKELKTWKNFHVRFFGEAKPGWKRKEVREFHNYGGTMLHSSSYTAKKRYPCYHPFLAPAIDSKGQILICCADPKGRSSVGNIRKMTLQQAWGIMGKTRSNEKKGVHTGICEECDVWQTYPNLFFSWQYGTSASGGSSTQPGG